MQAIVLMSQALCQAENISTDSCKPRGVQDTLVERSGLHPLGPFWHELGHATPHGLSYLCSMADGNVEVATGRKNQSTKQQQQLIYLVFGPEPVATMPPLVSLCKPPSALNAESELAWLPPGEWWVDACFHVLRVQVLGIRDAQRIGSCSLFCLPAATCFPLYLPTL
jgi:hypothetical protein